MIKIINGKKYNTETAESISYWSNGYSFTDANYRCKELFRTKKGNWFIYHEGGAFSDMGERIGNLLDGSSKIEAISAEKAYKFLEKYDVELLEKYFGEVEEA